MRWIGLICAISACLGVTPKTKGMTLEFDVVVYGGTAGGIATGIQVARMGRTVAVIEPSQHFGGLTSGGLGATDIGNKAAIGGISREFYQRIKAHYADPTAWIWQRADQFKSSRRDGKGTDAMWTFEPKVAERVLVDFATEAGVTLFRESRLDRENGVSKNGRSITEIRLMNGTRFRAKQFVDATYEGDLMAAAKVSYIVGREANAEYGETLNGVQTRQAIKHQLQPGVDPYVIQGNSNSGLLPNIEPAGPGIEGGRDHRVQAYCFRMCNTTHEPNRLPFTKPARYRETDFELLLRNFEAGAKIEPWHPIGMPNRKTDTNNNQGVSTDYIGQSYDWAEATYEQRDQIFQDHLTYQQGLMWTLANHPRVPEKIRLKFQRWGNCRDEFTDNAGWPHQLYVREARRMLSDYVMTQHHCEGRKIAEHSIGLAAYTMDSHNVQRYVGQDGFAKNEGDVQVGGFPPYPIAYESIIPKQMECDNLLVPICLSATHIAYGSIRMEPVFMVLGQSAATAACQAIEENRAVQEIDFDRLQRRLLKDKQVLQWTSHD